MQDFYTLVDNEGKFVYFVSGRTATDTVPRKSCAFGLSDGPKYIARAQADIDKKIVGAQEWLKIHPTNSYYQEELDRLQAVTFTVVKVSFTVV